ncbi:histidine phosphatase family protein [Bifidobacterium choloepi]|uniref:Histidine phosphatase family protein n=1 Tax=Bifidobacterium choloepi TaxID=2614131 RepID=A0A6I5N8W8_9BIFI|nr:histidine phosphatase family protein [Bifidobacterium choloepi]NEG70261.1 histidine phosphatase family protein [Bifidobacterium choloepi]
MGRARSITLTRHGRTSYNAAHRIQGWVDIPLDTVGLWQAKQTGEALRRLYVDHDGGRRQLVVASDLRRTQQTAHAFADPLGLEVHVDERFRERHFGEWEGRPVDELARDYPEDFRSWQLKQGGELKYGAEPRIHAGTRGVEALLDWAQRAGDDTDLFVFSHGALIECAVQVLFGMQKAYPDFVSLTSMNNAHWARLLPARLEDPSRWVLRDYNHGPAVADTDLWENPR